MTLTISSPTINLTGIQPRVVFIFFSFHQSLYFSDPRGILPLWWSGPVSVRLQWVPCLPESHRGTVIKKHVLWSWTAWVRSLPLPLTSCVVLGKLIKLSRLQLSHSYYYRNNKCTYLALLRGLTEPNTNKVFRTVPYLYLDIYLNKSVPICI